MSGVLHAFTRNALRIEIAEKAVTSEYLFVIDSVGKFWFRLNDKFSYRQVNE